MTDEHRGLVLEGRMTEDVIRMRMRADDVANRLVRARAPRGEASGAFPHATAGLDHRNSIVADNETDIGNGPLVVTRHERERACMHEHSGRHAPMPSFIGCTVYQRLHGSDATRRRRGKSFGCDGLQASISFVATVFRHRHVSSAGSLTLRPSTAGTCFAAL